MSPNSKVAGDNQKVHGFKHRLDCRIYFLKEWHELSHRFALSIQAWEKVEKVSNNTHSERKWYLNVNLHSMDRCIWDVNITKKK